MFTNLSVQRVIGLNEADNVMLQRLITIYNQHSSANEKKNRYYEGKIPLSEVNLGIALPKSMRELEIGCEWGAKCVDVLAARSMFDGFVNSNGGESELLNQIVDGNRFIAEYSKATRDELKYGCVFATISEDKELKAKIRFHTPETSAAEWNGSKGRLGCGMAIIDAEQNPLTKIWIPTIINLYTDKATVVIRWTVNNWIAEYHPHNLGRPLMEALVWNPTTKKPLGRSRLKASIRRLIQGYVRTIANATIALEFATTPQKYMIGLSDEQYDAVISDKFKQYVGSVLAATNNGSGEKPTFGQFSQGSLEPHVTQLRMLSTQFSAATGLTVTDVGVVNDANPTSSDAILAQSQTLVLMAEQLNTSNGDSLNMIAKMALAIATNKTLETLDDENDGLIAHFKNPAMPSVSVTADAAIKIATARPEFSGTDTFLEMIGFDQADIRRIKAQEQRARGQQVLNVEFSDENNSAGAVTNITTTESNREGAFAEVTPQSTLNGAQTSALINTIQSYKEGTLTREQAINIISVSIGVSKQSAEELLG